MLSSNIKGFLFDLDGVFHTGDTLLAGASETLSRIRDKKIPFCFLTNTTTKSKSDLARSLVGMGLKVDESEILNAPSIAKTYLIRTGNPRVYPLISSSAKEDLEGIVEDRRNPEAILIGDIGTTWSYELLNQLFHFLQKGARLVALHKGKYWQTSEGLMLDIGAFVAALEYASGVKAEVVGKPSFSFFQAGAERIGLPLSECAMVGDDIDSDIGAAQSLGIYGILVKTGKYRESNASRSNVKADIVLNSIADLFD
ncbi:TIGR01458 family HAD-type hydrolase [Leptospira perolatii]|uniref:Haloacid dehalogenase-like hydrolase domain-containing protein 2 n=1 Tax=Leptospira perolatii TaxID=2023191 RepID=A0A2M9ZNZ6_9LEPT|nr:TIGR01458 family HAD-type hydrolase [Leptospira perolatii]PJZ70907.1 TIGR01458 family HAD-type hydrolase [Leptospira perolatii]PJZ73802.1 TIGR01458 family HAD-type hydrolase [Leptospira perolatii]